MKNSICKNLINFFLSAILFVSFKAFPNNAKISENLTPGEIGLIFNAVERTIRNVTYDKEIDCKDWTILWYLNALEYCSPECIQIVVNRNSLTDMCHSFIMIRTAEGWKEIEPQDRREFQRVWKSRYNSKYNEYHQEEYIFNFARAEFRRMYHLAISE